MTKDDIIRKLTSRKFWAMVVLSCGCVAAGMSGYVDGETSLHSALATVVAYMIAEGAPDFARLISTKTIVSASSTDKATVAKVLAPETPKEGE